MRTTMMILAGLLLAASQANAQPAAPTGPPPTFKIVSSTDQAKGLVVFREMVYRYIPEENRLFKVVKGKRVLDRTAWDIKRLEEVRMIAVKVADCRVITPDGKQVPIDDVWKRVKVNGVVVVSADSNTPAQLYLQALSAESLVIIPPPSRSTLPHNEIVK